MFLVFLSTSHTHVFDYNIEILKLISGASKTWNTQGASKTWNTKVNHEYSGTALNTKVDSLLLQMPSPQGSLFQVLMNLSTLLINICNSNNRRIDFKTQYGKHTTTCCTSKQRIRKHYAHLRNVSRKVLY